MKYTSLTKVIFFLSFFFLVACEKEVLDERKLVPDPIFPEDQPNELNNALLILGELRKGALPETNNPEKINITVSVESASVTSNNFLFLPFAFQIEKEIQGIYLQVEGAEDHWQVPINLTDKTENSHAISIGIPVNIQKGIFRAKYKVYDTEGNISDEEEIEVAIVEAENRCGNGESFPTVRGEDGITVRTYDFGDEPGEVAISYFMYTQKDRMDIRYNNRWVASTAPSVLEEGQAPPIKECDVVTAAEGFVSGGSTFFIPYDPAVSREVSIYVSGCLQGGTRWYFDVICPESTGTPGEAICGNSTAQDRYDPIHPKYHTYPPEDISLTTVICDPKVDIHCSISAVFNAMLQQANFIAPTDDRKKVEDCKITWVNIVSSRNPIVSKVNRSTYTVTNYTLEDQIDEYGLFKWTHVFHPGKVVRTVKEEGGKVVVSTFGVGTGDWRLINESGFMTCMVWKDWVDTELKAYWDKQ